MSVRSSVDFHNLVIEAAENLRPLPETVIRLVTQASDPETTVEHIAETVMRDPMLSSAVLREANSAASASGHAVGTVETAIIRIGPARTVAIAVADGMATTTDGTMVGYGITSSDFWNHSWACMTVTDILVAASRGALDRMTVTAAILHDIGKVVLSDYLDPKHYFSAFEYSKNEVAADRLLVDVDHAEVGSFLAEAWGLPPEIAEAIRGHHRVDGNESEMALAVHAADIISHAFIADSIEIPDDEVAKVLACLEHLEIPKVKFLDRCLSRFEDVGLVVMATDPLTYFI